MVDDDADDTEADITLVGDPWTRSGEHPIAQAARGAGKKKSDIRELLARRTSSGVVSVASVQRGAEVPRPTPSAAPRPRRADSARVSETSAMSPSVRGEEHVSSPEPPPPPPVRAVAPLRPVIPAPPVPIVAPVAVAVAEPVADACAPPLRPTEEAFDVAYEDELRRMSGGSLASVTRLVVTALLFTVLVAVGLARLPLRAVALVARALAAHWTRAAAIVSERARSR